MDPRKRIITHQGFFTSLGPLAVLVALVVDARDPDPGAHLLRLVFFSLAGSLIFIGGFLLELAPSVATLLVRAGLLAVGLGLLPSVATSPSLVLAALLVVASLMVRTFSPIPKSLEGVPRSLQPRSDRYAGAVWVSGGAALAVWLLVGAKQLVTGDLANALTLLLFLVAGFHGARWVAVAAPRFTRWRWSVLIPSGLSLLLAVGAAGNPDLAFFWLAVHQVWFLFVVFRVQRRLADRLADLLANPARQLVLTFAFLGLVGGALLSFPISATHDSLTFLDGVFTAVSAACVTGLTVRDTALDFSFFGQVVILLLIQLGGLGIMTFSTAATLVFGGRLGLKTEATMSGLLGDGSGITLGRALMRVLSVTFVAEALGALALGGYFVAAGEPLRTAWWRGVFTSISAFCNAGFAIQSNNLVTYQHDPFVLHVVALLIIFGGLGPHVLVTIPALIRRRPASVHAKVVLVTTLLLLVLPMAVYTGLEWNATLAPLGVSDKIHNAWFQTVTPRTAGFNSVDLALLSPAATTLMILLMFIGGSPGSTAGGVKTSTLAILVLAVSSALRGRPEVTTFGRRIDHGTVYKAAAVMTVGGAAAMAGFFALQLTQPLSARLLVFETFSALGTVGLTIGATMQLDAIGKIIVIFLMYLGRIGPLSLLIFLSDTTRKTDWRLPEESIGVG